MHLNGDKRSASGATDPKRLTPSNEEVFDLPRRFAIQHLFSRSRRSARQARLRHYILFPPLSHPPPARNLPLATSIHSTKQPSYSPTSTSQLTDAPGPSKKNTLPLLPSPRLHLLHSKLHQSLPHPDDPLPNPKSTDFPFAPARLLHHALHS